MSGPARRGPAGGPRSARSGGPGRQRSQPASPGGQTAGGRSDARHAEGRVTTPRRLAYEVLTAVDRDDAYANLLLPARLDQAGLRGPDAGLATELCYGTLRRRGYYDAVIELAAGRPIAAIDSAVLTVLRLGAHQLLGLRLAPHAAVNESVELARRVASRGAAGFVNAVLRELSRRTAEQWRERVVASRSGDAQLAALHSHPEWIVRALREALAAEGRSEELSAALEADNLGPQVALVALPGYADAQQVLQAESGRLEPGAYSPYALRLSGGDPARVPAIAAGTVRVQDEGSQLVAAALVAAHEVVPRERWLDLCAGPGGKTALLAALGGAGVRLDANEPVPARAGLVRRALAPLGAPVEVSERDGRELADERAGRYDRVLLDAPCSGLGALRRRPEARWRKQPADLRELVAIQTGLLDSAVRLLRPGGLLAYVTCSPHPAETIDVVQPAIERHGLSVLDARGVVMGLSRDPRIELPARPLADGSTVQLWPHRQGTDGMFLALLRRKP